MRNINTLFRAEQSRAEQSRAEQSRAEQSRAEQSRGITASFCPALKLNTTFATDNRLILTGVFHTENRGTAAARNYGLQNALGEHIAFVDSDDIVKETMIEQMVRAAVQTGEQIVMGGFWTESEHSLKSFREYVTKENPPVAVLPFFQYRIKNNGIRTTVWGAMFGSSLIRDMRFDEDLYIGEDAYFLAKALKKARSFAVIFRSSLIHDLAFDPELYIGEDTFFFACALNRVKSLVWVDEYYYYYAIREDSVFHQSFNRKREAEFRAWEKVAELYSAESSEFQNEIKVRQLQTYMTNYGQAKQAGYQNKESVKEMLKKVKLYSPCAMRSRELSFKSKLFIRMFTTVPDFAIYVKSFRDRIRANKEIAQVAERRYPCIKEHALISKEKRRSIKNTIFSAFVFKISSVLLNATDNLLISVMIGTIAVGYYSNYHMIQTTVEGVFSLVFTSLTASIGNLLVKENAAKRYSVFTIEQDISFLICGIAVPCYTILVNDFIRLWIGSEYVLDKLLVASVGMNILLSFSMHPLWSFREASGLYRKTKWIMMICAAINLVLSVLLGKWMGTAGIIFASSISRISTYVWYEPKLLFRDYFEQSPRRYYLRLVVNFVFTVTETVLLLGITKNLQVYSWQSWFFKAVITVLASTAISFLFYRNCFCPLKPSENCSA